MVSFYGEQVSSRLLIGTALYPSPAIMQQAIRASGADLVTVSVRRETAGGKTGDAFWSLIRELGVESAAEHGRLPQRARGRDHGKAGARTVRHTAHQARGDRGLRDAAAGRDRAGGGRADPDQGRLRGLPLLHRGSRRRAASGRRRLPRHHAVGRSDRQRARHHQSRCAEAAAAAPAGHHAGGGRRASARRAMRRKRSSSATTRCCSTRRWRRPKIRSRWRMRSASPSTPAAPRSRPA